MFCFHLVIDGIDGFQTGFGIVFYAEAVELAFYRFGEIRIDGRATGFAFVYFFGNLAVDVRMFMLEAQILEFCLYGEKSEPVCQRSIYVECFAGYFVAFVRSHGAECAHIVQAVGHLDQHHTYVFAHGKQQFAEIFGLYRCFVAEYAA